MWEEWFKVSGFDGACPPRMKPKPDGAPPAATPLQKLIAGVAALMIVIGLNIVCGS